MDLCHPKAVGFIVRLATFLLTEACLAMLI
jgi:hypothetical protein